MKKNITLQLIVMLALIPTFSFAQNTHEKELIAKSQTGASPLFFYPNELGLPLIQSSNFANPTEFYLRDGLPNFFSKIASNENVRIAYLGGSITRSDEQYRVQSIDYIQSMYPDAKITGINAGVSGTGTDLGACRLYEQLLKYNPDLIFLEFAVNGSFAKGMEGIIRQIWKYNPKIDICLIYTLSKTQSKIYANGEVPQNIVSLDKLGKHYAIPSIHMGMEASFLEKQGKLQWKGDPELIKDKIVFSRDGVHPAQAGGNLYAASIARAFEQLKKNTTTKEHSMPEPLYIDNWEDAQMLDPKQICSFEGDWKKTNPLAIEGLSKFADWFPHLMKSEKPGSSFSFQFEGDMFGIFDIGGPEAGQLEIEMDGKPLHLKQTGRDNYVAVKDTSKSNIVNRFNRYCNNRYRGQVVFIDVPEGKHTVKITISKQEADKAAILGKGNQKDINENPENYNRTVEYLGKILIKGVIKNNL